MRYLFVHQNFPAQFLHLLRHLSAQQRHELIFITENQHNHIAGVRKLLHAMPKLASQNTHRDAKEFEIAAVRAQGVENAARSLRGLGYIPDIIIGHHGWGELLNMKDVWPESPL